jgi:hypothetical protein
MGNVRLFKLLAAVLVFAVLMAVRPSIEQVWARALIAACAGVALGWAVLQYARKR